jgi:phenylpropionate dioxygenase-like ring-hydroxylating dioxygenase large terminal subunit
MTQNWLRNCWYVIAWDHEIPADGLFTRTVLGEPILLYRTAAGGITALADRCCHRAAPLSRGRKEGDCVRCGYHGLKFNAAGSCVEVPGMEVVPPHLAVRHYPCVVHRRWVFVWMGDAAKADTALLPDNFSNEHPQWHYTPGYLHYDTPQALICDNLLDFSHLSYVHEKTLGGSIAIAQARPEISGVVNGMPGIKVARHVPNVPAPGYYRRMATITGNLDRWFIYDFVLPGVLLMHSGGAPTGVKPEDSASTVRLHSCQTVTPETENSTHYFFAQAHFGDKPNPEVMQIIYSALLAAFEEDRSMITAQARAMAAAPGLPTTPLHFDAALTRYRRLVDQAVLAEATAARV